jgi:hypothetical protein
MMCSSPQITSNSLLCTCSACAVVLIKVCLPHATAVQIHWAQVHAADANMHTRTNLTHASCIHASRHRQCSRAPCCWPGR